MARERGRERIRKKTVIEQFCSATVEESKNG